MHFDHTSLEEQAIVSSDFISPSRQTAAVTQGQQTAAIARNRQGASSVQSKEFLLGCMASFRTEVSNRGFLNKCQSYCRLHGDKKLPVSTKVPGRHGVAGVIRNKLVLFQHLFLAELLHKGYKYGTIGV